MNTDNLYNPTAANKVWWLVSTIVKLVVAISVIFAIIASVIFNNEIHLINERINTIVSQPAWRNTDNADTIANADKAVELSKLPAIFYDKQIRALYRIEYINTSYNMAIASACIQTPIDTQSEAETAVIQEAMDSIEGTADWYNTNVFTYSNTSIYLNDLGNTLVDIGTQLTEIMDTMQNSENTYEERKAKVVSELGNRKLEEYTDKILESSQELYLIAVVFTGVRIILAAAIVYTLIYLAIKLYTLIKQRGTKVNQQ